MIYTLNIKKALCLMLCLFMVFAIVTKPIEAHASGAIAIAMSEAAPYIISAIVAALGYSFVNDTQVQDGITQIFYLLPEVTKQALNSVPPPTGNNINIRDFILTAAFAGIVYDIYNVLSENELAEPSGSIFDITDYVYQGTVYDMAGASSNASGREKGFELGIPNFEYVFTAPEDIQIDENGISYIAIGEPTYQKLQIEITDSNRPQVNFLQSLYNENQQIKFWLCLCLYESQYYIGWAHYYYLTNGKTWVRMVYSPSFIVQSTESEGELIPVIIEPGVLTPGSVVTALEDAATTAQEQGTGVNVSTETEWNTQTQEQALDDIGALPYLDPVTEPILNDYKSYGLSDVFPFCIPFDVADMVTALQATREIPELPISIHFPVVDVDWEFTASLEDFDAVATVLRTAELIVFCIGLAMATRKVIKW